MAKSRPSDPSKRLRNLKTRSILNRTLPKPYRTAPLPSPAALLAEAADHLQTGTPSRALELATLALEILPSTNASLPVLNLLGEIHIELGDGNEARKFFERAIALDPGGTIPEADGGGAERFLWLAQLCDEGGRTSLGWFERGVEALEREIVGMQGEPEETLEGLKTKIAGALCGMVEIWMTDLSLEPEAEASCESLITRALFLFPTPTAPTLQTLASIRLSQSRLEDAQSALTRSLDLWENLPPEDPAVPDFPTRISLVRLLVEAEMEEKALEVLERLVEDDEESVEAWYLGGWCLYLMGEKAKVVAEQSLAESDQRIDESRALGLSSRDWLSNALRLFDLIGYEDEKLREHALELVALLDGILGDKQDGDECEEWEDKEDEDRAEDYTMRKV